MPFAPHPSQANKPLISDHAWEQERIAITLSLVRLATGNCENLLMLLNGPLSPERKRRAIEQMNMIGVVVSFINSAASEAVRKRSDPAWGCCLCRDSGFRGFPHWGPSPPHFCTCDRGERERRFATEPNPWAQWFDERTRSDPETPQ